MGTHIYSSNDLCAIEYLDRLISSGIKVLKIDGILKTDKELVEIVRIYKDAINSLNNNVYENNKTKYINELQEINHYRKFDTGFLFKKTIYKGDKQ